MKKFSKYIDMDISVIEYIFLDLIVENLYKESFDDFLSWFRGSLVPFLYLEVLCMAKMAQKDPGSQKFKNLDKFYLDSDLLKPCDFSYK